MLRKRVQAQYQKCHSRNRVAIMRKCDARFPEKNRHL